MVPHLVTGEDSGPRASQVVARPGTPESQLLRADLIEILLGRLKERDAEIIRLRELESRSFEEIARLWGKTPGAVQRAFSRAWKSLLAVAQTFEGD